MRLIDGEAVLSGIRIAISREPSWNHGGLRIAKGIVESLPAIDAVEVVRCKDCKHYEIYQLKKDGTDDRRYRPSYCANLAFHAQPDWFCADGERKEDE